MYSMFYYVVIALLAIISVLLGIASIISTDLLAFFLFILLIAFLICKDRKRVKLEGLIFIRRTQKGIDFINNAAKRFPKLWKFLGLLGVVVSIPIMIYISFYLIEQTAKIALGLVKFGGVGIVLPGPTSAPIVVPGAFILPWWIWVIGIAFVIFPHEISHGIICRLHNIRIKSVGWILFLILPGAFVEQDDKQLAKKSRLTKMKVYAAGSFANLLLAFVILLILSISSLAFTPAGLAAFTIKDTPAYNANLTGSIMEMDGRAVNNITDVIEVMNNHKPGDTIEVKTVENKEFTAIVKFGMPESAVIVGERMKSYNIILSENPDNKEKPFIGIREPFVQSYRFSGPFILYMVALYLFIFSFGIGLVNLLPIKPLDGGLIFEEIARKFSKGYSSVIVKFVSVFMAAVLIFNIVGPIIF